MAIKRIALSSAGLFLFLSWDAAAFVKSGTYPSRLGRELLYVAAGPMLKAGQRAEVWIYQDGDGNVLQSFSRTRAMLRAKSISAATGVVFVWPELRREALSDDLKGYCELDYLHRAEDLHSLIDVIKAEAFADPAKIVLVGSSAGSEIVTVVAAQRSDVAAVTTIGGGVLQLADYARGANEEGVLENVHNVCKDGTYERRSGTFWQQLLFSDLFRYIKNTQRPYLAIVGEDDPITRNDITRPHALGLERQNPKFKYLTVEDMGHGFGWMRPWRWRVIRDWTKTHW